MKLSIIIVSYNVKYYLTQCLTSIWRSDEKDIEVFVVDNASKDDTLCYLRDHFPCTDYPQLHLIESKKNLGFGKANNLALKQTQGDYILFLNPDTLLTEHTLSDCLAFAATHPQLGALGVRMLKDAGGFAFESRRGLPTPWVAFCKMTGLATLFPTSRLFGKYYMRNQNEYQPQEIEVVSGAFMMLSRQAAIQTRGFDEQFFMYGEDIDLSYRILKAGYKNYYIPTEILHYKGESTQKNSFRYVHVFYEAMLIFFHKHYPHARLWLSLPIKVAIVTKAIFALIRQQLQRFHHFLSPSTFSQPNYIYIGTHKEEINRLAERNGLQIDCYTELPEHIGPKYTIVCFDTDNYSFSDILTFFSKSSHQRYIGLYYNKDNKLITGGEIFLYE